MPVQTTPTGLGPDAELSRRLDRQIAKIQLDLDPDPELVRLARLVVSGIASVADMSLEEVEDCRAAVDEMCSALLEVGADEGVMHLELWSDGREVEVSGKVPVKPGGAIDKVRHELSEMILDAVTDEHELRLDGEMGSFRFRRSGQTRGGSG